MVDAGDRAAVEWNRAIGRAICRVADYCRAAGAWCKYADGEAKPKCKISDVNPTIECRDRRADGPRAGELAGANG